MPKLQRCLTFILKNPSLHDVFNCNYFKNQHIYLIEYTNFTELPRKIEREGKYSWLPLEAAVVRALPEWKKRPYYCRKGDRNGVEKEWVLICEDTWNEVIRILIYDNFQSTTNFTL